jgi:hypothetical protein
MAVTVKKLDKPLVTPGGRFAFQVVPRGAFTKATHPVTTYSDTFDLGEWEFLQIIQDIYATSVTDAGDVMDVIVEFSSDGTKWWNGGTFTQQAGNGVAKREVMTFKNSLALDPDAIFTFATAATVVHEKLFGRYMRVGIGVTDAGTDGKHYMGVSAYIK